MILQILTWQRERRTRLFVFIVFVFLELRDETEFSTPTSLWEICQMTLQRDTWTDRTTLWLNTLTVLLVLKVLAVFSYLWSTSWSDGSMAGHNQETSASRQSCRATELRAAFSCSCWGGSNCYTQTHTHILMGGPWQWCQSYSRNAVAAW